MHKVSDWKKWCFGVTVDPASGTVHANWNETPKVVRDAQEKGAEDEEEDDMAEFHAQIYDQETMKRAVKGGLMLGQVICQEDWRDPAELACNLMIAGTGLVCHEPLLLGDDEDDAHWNSTKTGVGNYEPQRVGFGELFGAGRVREIVVAGLRLCYQLRHAPRNRSIAGKDFVLVCNRQGFRAAKKRKSKAGPSARGQKRAMQDEEEDEEEDEEGDEEEQGEDTFIHLIFKMTCNDCTRDVHFCVEQTVDQSPDNEYKRNVIGMYVHD